MRAKTLAITILGLAALVAVSSTAFTEEEAGGDMEAWMAMGKPGSEHEWLSKFEGEWTSENKFWQGPGEPMTSTGKATTKMIWGGRYLEMSYEGDMQGMKFTGRGLWAYDNAAKRFTGTWIDSMSTAVMVSRGTREGEILTWRGKMHSPMGEIETRDEVKWDGEDRYTYSSFWSMPQGETKTMELTYTRVGAKKAD